MPRTLDTRRAPRSPRKVPCLYTYIYTHTHIYRDIYIYIYIYIYIHIDMHIYIYMRERESHTHMYTYTYTCSGAKVGDICILGASRESSTRNQRVLGYLVPEVT